MSSRFKTRSLSFPPSYDFSPKPPRFPVCPREEEGLEVLPSYSEAVRKTGFLKRKIELVSPFESSPNRRWKQFYVDLNNTQLNLYSIEEFQHSHHDYGPLPHNNIKKYVSLNSNSSNENERKSRIFNNNLLKLKHHFQKIKSKNRHKNSTLTVKSTISSSSFTKPTRAKSSIHDSNLNKKKRVLIRCYTLQRAKVGVAHDYIKRDNILRLRIESEQILLQCESIEDMIEWYWAISTGIQIALPLELRQMPKFKTLPRNRVASIVRDRLNAEETARRIQGHNTRRRPQSCIEFITGTSFSDSICTDDHDHKVSRSTEQEVDDHPHIVKKSIDTEVDDPRIENIKERSLIEYYFKCMSSLDSRERWEGNPLVRSFISNPINGTVRSRCVDYLVARDGLVLSV